MSEFITRLTKGCQAEELEQKIQQEIFALLSSRPRLDALQQAKLTLQELYHQYRKTNPCRASAFTALHRCIYQVYVENFERLDALTPTALPAPKKKREKSIPQDTEKATVKTPEEILAEQIAGIRRMVNNEKPDTSSE